MYGAQTINDLVNSKPLFENDVEMYGAQTRLSTAFLSAEFENDVEMYGAQAKHNHLSAIKGLRMM